MARACRGPSSLPVEKAHASNMQLVLKMHPGKQCGGVKAGFTGDLSLSFLAASLHREGINSPPQNIAELLAAPSPSPSKVPMFWYCPLVWDHPTPCGFSARQAVCPEVPQPSSPAPGRIRLP